MHSRIEQLAQALKSGTFLVTGGTGSLGRPLVETLATVGDVHVLTREPDRAAQLWHHPGVILHSGSLQDRGLLDELCGQVDTVFHLASYSPRPEDKAPEDNPAHWTVTAEGTSNLVDAIAGSRVRQLVFASSTRAIDGSETLYARAKRAAEERVLAARTESLEVTVLRLAPLYGFKDQGNIAWMISMMERGKFPPLPDLGDRRSLLHYVDAIQAMVLAATKSAGGGAVYTVTDGEVYSVRRIYEMVYQRQGKNPPGWTVPLWLLTSAAAAGDLVKKLTGVSVPLNGEKLDKLRVSAQFDSSGIQRELGFDPIFTLDKSLDFVSR